MTTLIFMAEDGVFFSEDEITMLELDKGWNVCDEVCVSGTYLVAKVQIWSFKISNWFKSFSERKHLINQIPLEKKHNHHSEVHSAQLSAGEQAHPIFISISISFLCPNPNSVGPKPWLRFENNIGLIAAVRIIAKIRIRINLTRETNRQQTGKRRAGSTTESNSSGSELSCATTEGHWQHSALAGL